MRFCRKRDIIIISFISLVCLALYAVFNFSGTTEGAVAEIVDLNSKEIIYSVNLSLAEDEIFSLSSYENVVFEIRNGKISFYDSDCPDGVCMKSGELSLSGSSAACIPNGLLLRITTEDGSGDYDVIL